MEKLSEDNVKQFRFILIALILTLIIGCDVADQPTNIPQTAAPGQTPVTLPPTPTLASAVPTTAVQPTDVPSTQAVPPGPTSLPEATAITQPPAAPTQIALTSQEKILIQEPGPGWRLTSPIHVSGMADPTFEQNLVVRLLTAEGSELALVPVTIAADNGQRGPFSVDIPFSVSGEQQAFLQVYAASARDGGVTHLSSVGIRIADSGPEERPAFTPLNERIVIDQPAFNAAVSGGFVHIQGVALASFEATLVVELLDESGNIIGSEPVLVQAPDIGQPGFFEANISYPGGTTGPGRIVIHDISPAFGGDVHLASIEIQFE